LGDVVSEFCDTDKSALSHRCFPPQGLFHIATPLCNRAYLPAYSPELNPVERVFCEVRRCVEGVVYGSLEAKLAAVEGALGGLREGMVRLVGWDWIREALEGLPCD
jgi:hypothetical protein